jgi:hypothetical protein
LQKSAPQLKEVDITKNQIHHSSSAKVFAASAAGNWPHAIGP